MKRVRAGTPVVVPTRRMWFLAVVVAVVAIPNFYAVGITIHAMSVPGGEADWLIMTEAGRRVVTTGLYSWGGGYTFQYSPLLAYAWLTVGPAGLLLWRLAHFVALLALPRRIAIATVLLYPFWWDVFQGNVVTFSFVLAALAIRGSRWAAYAYLALVLLVPRPLYLPVAAWLLWHRRELRWPFAAIALVNVTLVLGSGWADEWITRLALAGGVGLQSYFNFGPARILGPIAIPIGLVLAGILARRGRLGWASLAASAYLWLPYYFIFGLLELVPTSGSEGRRWLRVAVRDDRAVTDSGTVEA